MKLRSVLVAGMATLALLTASPAVAAPAGPGVQPAAPDAGQVGVQWAAECQFDKNVLVLNFVPGVHAYLIPDGALDRGEYCQIGKAKLVMEHDGDLVVWDENNVARWRARWTHPGVVNWGWRAVFQTDGNFVVYPAFGSSLWASNTCCTSTNTLAVQSDGNIVIYGPGRVVRWTTNTHH